MNYNSEWEELNLTRPIPKSFAEMATAMLNCEQTKGQTVYQHGMSVTRYLNELIDHVTNGSELDERRWRIPTWFRDFGPKLVSNLWELGKRELYTLYHDCGKPYCRWIDKKTDHYHFPNHAEVSSYIWACVGGNEVVRHLIAYDMVIHTASAEEIEHKVKEDWELQTSCTLLLAALAEVHSNATMFGGTETVSFKSKWKIVDRRGKQICKILWPNADFGTSCAKTTSENSGLT